MSGYQLVLTWPHAVLSSLVAATAAALTLVALAKMATTIVARLSRRNGQRMTPTSALRQ